MLEYREKFSSWAVLVAALVAALVFAPALSAAANATLYIVQKGDTLSAIAKRHGSTVAAVAGANNLANPNLIFPGQRLEIPSEDGTVYTIRPGDTLWDISQRQGITLTALKEANPGIDPNRLVVGSTISLPRSDRLLASRQATGLALTWPVTGRISSSFGWRHGRMHQGLDIAAAAGYTIVAAASGQVTNASWYGGYGQRLIIDHGRSIRTLYAHCSALLVKPGEQVQAGQAIARVGTTGNSTGPHLHFEVHIGGRPYDPLQFLK